MSVAGLSPSSHNMATDLDQNNMKPLDIDESLRGPRTFHFKDGNTINFEDGNIIVRATGIFLKTLHHCTSTKLPPPVHFRVHKSILKTHSRVFADVMKLRVPAGKGEDGDAEEAVIRGLPILELHDHPADIVKLMEVLYMSM